MDILLEQLVYGSFPFWDRGYDVLARSPGCRADWVADVLTACRQFGEAPAGSSPSFSFFAIRLASGPWAIVGVDPQGNDDRGRPGALAFHALLVEPRDYRRAGANPFVFAGSLRRDWSASSSLVAFFLTVEVPLARQPPTDPRARRVVEALSRGRRVALESADPIEALARDVWPALPEAVRRRASVATRAFGNANRFDLVALPRLAGVSLDASYVDPASLDADLPKPLPLTERWKGWPRPTRRFLTIAGLAGVVATGLTWWVREDRRGSGTPPASQPAANPVEVEPEERARIVAGLEALAERFAAFDIDRSGDPTDLMKRISGQIRYRGPFLSADERDRLAAEPDPDRDRALAWHEWIKTFADDRSLTSDFSRLPFRSQLDQLARSFHLDPPDRAEAIPEALAEALAREGPVRPTPLAVRYPALSDYARFLGRLPRRSGQ